MTQTGWSNSIKAPPSFLLLARTIFLPAFLAHVLKTNKEAGSVVRLGFTVLLLETAGARLHGSESTVF